jgi:ferredoxin
MTERLHVDPIACIGHGLCAELLPERIVLDDWGYPIVDGAPIPPELRAHARRAADACPKLALRLAAAGRTAGNEEGRRPEVQSGASAPRQPPPKCT